MQPYVQPKTSLHVNNKSVATFSLDTSKYALPEAKQIIIICENDIGLIKLMVGLLQGKGCLSNGH